MKEFARLNHLWLDGLATAEEAAAHWRMVAEHEECARELAAAARFEAMLEKRLGEAERVNQAMWLLRTVALSQSQERHSRTWRGLIKPALRVAAAVVVVSGMVWWMLEHTHEGRIERSAWRVAGGSFSKTKVNQKRSSVVEEVPSTAVVKGEESLEWTGESLRIWLEAYYLNGVALNKVELKEALGKLQADMVAVNFLNAEVVGRLRVTVSVDAAARRVSLKSGPISFYKAVKTLAAQAGCEVEVGELLLAVESRDQSFPQPTARHDMREVLAGRFDADGIAETDRADLMAKVWADAVDHGFVAADALGSGSVRLTQGQVETLRGLAEARAQLDLLPAKTYQWHLAVPGEQGPARALDEGEVKGILEREQSSTHVPKQVLTLRPGQRMVLEDEGSQLTGMELEFLPVGQGFQVGIVALPNQWGQARRDHLAGNVGRTGEAVRQLDSPAVAATSLVHSPVPVVVMSGQGAVLSLDSGSPGGSDPRSETGTLGASVNSSQMKTATTITTHFSSASASSVAAASQVVLLPVNPTNETPQSP